MVTGDSQEEVIIFRYRQTHMHHNIYIIIIIIIMIKVAMTVTKSNHFPGYLVSDEGMLTLSASSHHNQSKESGREQGLTSKELREKQKYKTLKQQTIIAHQMFSVDYDGLNPYTGADTEL